MDKITVAELATECSVQNQVVLAELKRLGLYVFSPTATIDANFAETIRKKIFSQREAEEARKAEEERKAQVKKEKEAEAARKAEKKEAAKKAAAEAEEPPAPAAEAPAREAAKTAAAKAAPPRKRKSRRKRKRRKRPSKSPNRGGSCHKPSLAPRKGRKHYDRSRLPSLVEVAVAALPKAHAS